MAANLGRRVVLPRSPIRGGDGDRDGGTPMSSNSDQTFESSLHFHLVRSMMSWGALKFLAQMAS